MERVRRFTGAAAILPRWRPSACRKASSRTTNPWSMPSSRTAFHSSCWRKGRTGSSARRSFCWRRRFRHDGGAQREERLHERKRLSVWSSTALRPGGVRSSRRTATAAVWLRTAFWRSGRVHTHGSPSSGRGTTTSPLCRMRCEKALCHGTNNVTGWAAYTLS